MYVFFLYFNLLHVFMPGCVPVCPCVHCSQQQTVAQTHSAQPPHSFTFSFRLAFECAMDECTRTIVFALVVTTNYVRAADCEMPKRWPLNTNYYLRFTICVYNWVYAVWTLQSVHAKTLQKAKRKNSSEETLCVAAHTHTHSYMFVVPIDHLLCYIG